MFKTSPSARKDVVMPGSLPSSVRAVASGRGDACQVPVRRDLGVDAPRVGSLPSCREAPRALIPDLAKDVSESAIWWAISLDQERPVFAVCAGGQEPWPRYRRGRANWPAFQADHASLSPMTLASGH